MRYLKACYSEGGIEESRDFWKFSAVDEIIEHFLRIPYFYQEKYQILSLSQNNPTAFKFPERISLVKLDLSSSASIKRYMGNLLYHSGYITGRIENERLEAVIPNKTIKKTLLE